MLPWCVGCGIGPRQRYLCRRRYGGWRGHRGGGNLESYLGIGALKGYIPEDWHDNMIEFVIPGVQNKTVRGITADTFLDICRAYVRALDDGALTTDRQKDIAAKASMFLAACAKVGLTALIDEATGYQYERAEDALQFKLRLFLEEEMRKWEATFPDELWREFGRLTNWSGGINQRPKYWGKLVMELVYEYLDPDVAVWLKENNPKPRKGQNHHQWLSSQYGLRRLVEHIWMVIGLAKACESMSELKTRMAELYGREPVLFTMHLPPPNAPTSAPPATRLPRISPSSENAVLPLEMEVLAKTKLRRRFSPGLANSSIRIGLALGMLEWVPSFFSSVRTGSPRTARAAPS